ncbi:ABC transporter permease [Nonomuraea dietziae]|uniref:ABC transporter permease n=1 Tax=Nonomuraea dietziae TaxID=65515 RepID=UPI003405D947
MRRLLRLLASAAGTLLAASLLVWGLAELSPGDPARQVLLSRGVAVPVETQIEAVRAELGLADAAPVRYARWLGGALTGDLGSSWRTGRPVTAELGERLPATLRLCLTAVALAILPAFALAFAGALGRHRWPDALSRGVMFAAAAVPSFLLGVALLEIVVVRWGVGRVVAEGGWADTPLPAATLAAGIVAQWARVTRGALIDAASAPFADVSRARGSGELRVLLVHGLPHAAPPLLAVVGMTVGGLLAGAAVVESVFTWPGVGRLLVEAITARDLPVVQGCVLAGVLAFLAGAVAADLATRAGDPRL